MVWFYQECDDEDDEGADQDEDPEAKVRGNEHSQTKEMTLFLSRKTFVLKRVD